MTCLRPAAALLVLLASTPAQAVTCTNPASGASWQVAIDDAHATVDSFPARTDGGVLTWHDLRDNGRYALDRASGALTVVIPSSTGGYILHDRCRVADQPAHP